MVTKLLRLIAALLTLAGVGFAVTMPPPAAHTTQLKTPVKLPPSQAVMFYNGPQVVQAELHLIRPRPRPRPVRHAQPTPSPSPSSTYVPPPSISLSGVQLIAYNLMPEFGLEQSQFSCLVSLWNRESGWRYDAEEPTSGAYGIPQSLPASKMSMFGSDYLTDPTTQIKWGEWYVHTVYGTACNAWYHDYTDGYY